MFCPKCATQNLDGASFCRTCGANISLVPQALTGQMVQAEREEVDESPRARRRRGRRDREPTLDSSFKNVFMGVAFLIIAIALSRTIGAGWWFWMLIPAFSLMGTGLAQLIRVREREKRGEINAPPSQPVFPKAPPALPRRTDELRPPVPSVTEGTTRHLGVEAPTRHLETHERK
jgi:uncharacterized Zn finger protein (UPF0148 family)